MLHVLKYSYKVINETLTQATQKTACQATLHAMKTYTCCLYILHHVFV